MGAPQQVDQGQALVCDPPAPYLPAAQLKQSLAAGPAAVLAVVYFPGAQSPAQELLVSPPVPYRPAEQSLHELAPPVEYCPAAQPPAQELPVSPPDP